MYIVGLDSSEAIREAECAWPVITRPSAKSMNKAKKALMDISFAKAVILYSVTSFLPF